jgi:hypothetical protein
MNRSYETRKRSEEKRFYEKLILLLEKQSKDYEKNNKLINVLTVCSVLIALSLFWVAFQQMNIEKDVSESNKILANVTADEYGYHQPDVSLIDSYFLKLYVYEINETTTKFSFLNIARVYNSAQSDDIALVAPKGIMKAEQISPDHVTYIEGLPFPVPIIPGNAPQEIPFYRTIVSTHEANHEKFGFNLNDTLEVNHPNGSLIKEILVPTTSNIMYTRGDETVIVKVDNNLSYAIHVRFTDNGTIYDEWKTQFLLKYSNSAVTSS